MNWAPTHNSNGELSKMSSSEEKLEALASFTSSLLASAAANENEKNVDDKPTEEIVSDLETRDKVTDMEASDKEKAVEVANSDEKVETSAEDEDDTRHQLEEHLDLGEEILEAQEEPEAGPLTSYPVDSEATESTPMEIDPNDTTQNPARSEGSRPATPTSRCSRPVSPASPRDIEIEYKDEDDKVTY